MAKPIVKAGGRERLDEIDDAEVLDVAGLRRLTGSMTFEDFDVPSPVTLAELVTGGQPGEARVSGLKNQGSGQMSILSPTQIRFTAGTSESLVERQAGGLIQQYQVSWTQEDFNVSGLANPVSYYVVQDAGFTGTGTIVELSSPPGESRSEIGTKQGMQCLIRTTHVD